MFSFDVSRRQFLSWTNKIVVGGGLATSSKLLQAQTAGSPESHNTEDYYDKLGVQKIINAAGTFTFLTASIMPPSVQAAVTEAAKHPVRLKDLQIASGQYLAKKLKCEAALVSSGAASALTLGTAAAITVNHPDAIARIPVDMTGLKNEVIVQKTHRYDYDHALLNCGIKFVEVETLEQYRAAFNERTVLAHFFNAAADQGKISREDWIRVAHEHNVPCMNDAAADVPPISNLWNYTAMGFDLVCFSGGKGMRGPQNAGLLLGKKPLIDAAMANDSPISETVGRGMKVAKEQIVGMVAAVDWFLSQSDESMRHEFQERADYIASQLHDIPTLKSSVYVPGIANQVPHLLLNYDQAKVKISPHQVMEQMRAGSPSIELNPATGTDGRRLAPWDTNTVVVGVWMLQPGEEKIVARRLHQVLTGAVAS